MNQQLSEINTRVDKAILQLYQRDLYLLSIGVHERTVSHKLAEYLQQEFKGAWNVDCEYNRDELESKSLEMIVHDEDEKRQHKIYPDIIVHLRGKSGGTFNKLAIEIKTSDDSNDGDIQKLSGLTSLKYNFKYQYGLFLRFNHNFKFTASLEEFVIEKRWFNKGLELDYEKQ